MPHRGVSIDYNRRTALYRLYDKKGRLLYVGISYNPKMRWNGHASIKRWWKDVAEKTVEWYPTRHEAMDAEVAAIQAESPLYNVQDSATPYEGSTLKRGIKPQRMIRVVDDVWEDYERLCKESGTTPEEDITRHIRRRLRRHRVEQRRLAPES